DLSELVSWLADRGFARLERVEAPGDFAVRGDIVDVFVPGESDPLRIEFFDDRIESIRRFDISTQRSQKKLPAASISAPAHCQAAEGGGPDQSATFFRYLPADALVVLDEPGEIQEMGRTLHDRLPDAGEVEPVAEVLTRAAAFDQVHLSRLGAPTEHEDDGFAFEVSSLTRFEGKADEAITELCSVAADHQVYVFCDNQGERKRLTEILIEQAGEVPPSLHMPVGPLQRGFEWVPARTICVAHHELFHRYRQRRRIRRVQAGRPLESWLDLEPGDLVVHVVHGIARFTGIRTLPKGGADDGEEFLTLQFADRAALHVPISQIDLVQKYVGAGALKPTLSKLGGTRWRKTTERVEEAVSDLAAALLAVQAARESNPGIPYPADTPWQREFEGSFVYEETEDQLVVSEQVKSDLQRTRPTDRLLCGDVGYGKTELAIRAAFKVVEYGKQVAVLVPTTVLAEQHYQTFAERLADYPFEIRCLSRFRRAGEQRKIIEDAKKGRVDILIGTHRMLSKDVGFADLGLVVIDEEQRFGVEHKDKLKQLRHTVDVLTMTATPIPRTLHMAMLGIRDISSLATPPLDRRAIATQIRPFDTRLIREAVLGEMNRDGQVYFVHNYVRSIQRMADEVRKIVPEARVLVGHGQMKEGHLEKVMTAFVRHQADVLVATTIIESGIDIPRVNTIFIDQADRFGLADLHQLRGRVGRSKHRAYCYLLLPRNRPVTPKAARRLKSIEEFSELGAGFRIAMRDLEIRGAGNILGGEQSGNIAAVGYEMYCQILERTVRRLRGEPDLLPPRVHLEIGVSGHVPARYIASSRARLDVYKRIVSARTLAELQQVDSDLVDAFGRYPPEVGRLLELAEVRVRARDWRVRSIVLHGPDVIFTVKDHQQLEPVFAGAPGTARMPDAKTVHWRLPPSYLEPPTLLAVLRKRLSVEAEASVL
ncbi:MAG: transcription-repair coupling factor, partial [Planctomycetota bacterium]